MRIAAGLLLLAGVAAAAVDYDQVTEWIENEQFQAAYEALRVEVPPETHAERFWKLWRDAVRGVARDKQRVGGYGEAIVFLEHTIGFRPTRLIVEDYVETCIWAGEERRGLMHVRTLPQPLRDRCAVAEFQLYWVRQDYAAMEKRAREVNWDSWVQFAREQRELRERFAERTARAWRVAIGGIVAILVACFAVDRLLLRKKTA